MFIFVCYDITFITIIIFWIQENDKNNDIFWLSFIFFIYVNLTFFLSKITPKLHSKRMQTIWTLSPIVLLLIFVFIYFIFKIVENWSKIL